jgi:hypothetical protein
MTAPRHLALRRALLVAGLALLGAGLATLPAGARPAAAAPAAAGGTQVTVQGPRLYNGHTANCAPPGSCLLPQRSTVTVSQAGNVTNQEIRVSWAHFTPSSLQGGQGYNQTNTLYAVEVAECKGTHPTQWSQCYLADNGGVAATSGPDGPSNATFTVTAPNGTGAIDIAVETKVENSLLGCDQQHPCSLVVVPGQGGNENVAANTFQCNDHSQDQALSLAGPEFTFNSTSGFCSWRDRIVIPLHFAPVDTGCPGSSPQFQAGGSPMMARAMLLWQSGLCGGASPLSFSYDSQVAEPLALREAAGGLFDVALTTRPAGAEGITLPSSRHYVYAPIAVSAVSIAYWIDNTSTLQPVTSLKLSPRLVEKLITMSYSFGDACSPGQPSNSCDKGVNGNPLVPFQDPEFNALNPGIPDPGQQWEVPIMQSGNSDLTWTLTRWMAANPAASAFLRGRPAPGGMHVNTYFRGLHYPTDIFTNQDPFPVAGRLFNPLLELSKVAVDLSLNQDAGLNFPNPNPPNPPPYVQDPAETIGSRALFAITDEADAAGYGFPVAAISNPAGRYVRPTDASMAAALQHMTSDGSGTVQVNLANTDPAAYPLTMVVYAAVPTAGTPHAKAAAIARFLDFAAGAGQTPGEQPGQLFPGYLPLPDAMRAQTRQAATEVANQTGATGSSTGTSSHSSPSPSPTASPIPSLSAKPTSSPSLSLPTPSILPITTTTVADPQQAASTRYVLPVLLMLGGLSALAGSSALMASGRVTVLDLLGRARRAGLARGRRAFGRRSPRRQP